MLCETVDGQNNTKAATSSPAMARADAIRVGVGGFIVDGSSLVVSGSLRLGLDNRRLESIDCEYGIPPPR